jgi:CO/xanthine dehydrogenase Mo-binding subunit/CO/xanthine dehydrogenase FAD-binding subunit
MPSYPAPFRISQPATVAEASALVVEDPDAVLYAGGTELLLAMKHGGLEFGHLVDLKGLPGLAEISVAEGAVRLGALATHRTIARSSAVRDRLPELARLESRIANPRVRATGTLGGNLAFGEPQSDPATLLRALEARLTIEGSRGVRTVEIGDLLLGAYETSLARGEVLTRITIPLPGSGQRIGYHKVQLHERPMLGLALRLDVDDSGSSIVDARVVIGAASPTPRRSEGAEQALFGELADATSRVALAAERLAADAELIDDEEGSADYKQHLIGVHLGRLTERLVRDQPPHGERRDLRGLVAGWRAAQHHEPKPGFRVVGHSVARTDGPAKVTGQATYTGDVRLPGMAHAKVLRSPVAHATIRSIDTTAARAASGVLDVLVGSDLLPLPSPRYGHAIRDHWILAVDKVRYAGEPVAAVIAESEPAAQHALELIDVEYDELPPVMTAEEALGPEAPLIHEAGYEVGRSPGHVNLATVERRSNLLSDDVVRWGAIDDAFERAAVVVEGEYYYPMSFAYPLEPYVALADFGDEELTVYSCGQHTYMVRRDLADVFDLPLSRVRVITPFVGGGFGSKSYTKVEPLAAVCSWRVRRPVRLELTVEETILTTRADDARIWLRTAADADGRLIARQARCLLNSGAYAENSMLVSAKTAARLVGPYALDAVDIVSQAAYTTTAPASSYRGFGGFHATLASEIQLDQIAERLELDPLELRLRNLVKPGTVFYPGKRPMTADPGADLRLVADALGWSRRREPGAGIGAAINAIDAGAAPVGRSEVRIHGDGSVTVLSGSAELGQGSRTVLAQIAAEEFGLELHQVRVAQSDTAVTPFARTTGADRTTTMEGTTVLLACRDAKDQLLEMAQDVWEAPPEVLQVETPGIRLPSKDEFMGWGDIIGRYFRQADMEITGRGHIRPVGDWGLLPPFWELPLVGVEVETDAETGDWRVSQLVTLGDVGLAINPAMAEGQDLGSAVMGLGVAMREELVYEGQQLLNGSVLGYRVPGFTDVPDLVQGILVEGQDGIGPYGAKGHGDGSLSSVSAAVANALHDALGVWLHQPPFTPERVWRAMRDGEQGPSIGRSPWSASMLGGMTRPSRTPAVPEG